jgi:methyl coenzyme M reductase subunit D
MVTQSNVSSAGSMIGKTVEGMDEKNQKINGVVTSVRVQDGSVFLELDSGKRLGLERVTTIAPTPVAAAA